MTGRARWRSIVFLIITAAAVAWELVASFDGNPDTWPWTQLIVTYVPWWVTFPAIAVLVVWLPLHFWGWYRRRQRARRVD